MADSSSVTPALATLGGGGWTVPQPTPYVGGTLAPPYTWAGKPAANTVPLGTIIRITDFGKPFLMMMSDGVTWVPLGPQILDRNSAAVSTTGDLNENVLRTVTIPAGAMGLNGGLLINSVWSYTNSANAKTPRVRFGGIGGTPYTALAQTSSLTFGDQRRIRNRGSASSQVGSNAGNAAFGALAQAVITSTVDTSVAQDVVLTGQLALATETITLESYEVWLLP